MNNFEKIKQELNTHNIPFNYYDLTKYFVIDSYCETQKDTALVLKICKKYNGKAFATENKLSL
jgi:hypothetical protein